MSSELTETVSPESGSDSELTVDDFSLLKIVTELIVPEMIGDLGSTQNVASMYGPFQVLLRQVMIAAVEYFNDHGHVHHARVVRDLLDSGRLDSPSVARVPSSQEVARLIMQRMQSARMLRQQDLWDQLPGEITSLVADAMDCAYKQAIGAPQTIGSRFTRPEQPA